MSLIEQQAGS